MPDVARNSNHAFYHAYHVEINSILSSPAIRKLIEAPPGKYSDADRNAIIQQEIGRAENKINCLSVSPKLKRKRVHLQSTGQCPCCCCVGCHCCGHCCAFAGHDQATTVREAAATARSAQEAERQRTIEQGHRRERRQILKMRAAAASAGRLEEWEAEVRSTWHEESRKRMAEAVQEAQRKREQRTRAERERRERKRREKEGERKSHEKEAEQERRRWSEGGDVDRDEDFKYEVASQEVRQWQWGPQERQRRKEQETEKQKEEEELQANMAILHHYTYNTRSDG